MLSGEDETSEGSETEDPEGVELVPKRVSVVWKFFGFRNCDVDQTIVCNRCGANVVAAGGNTRCCTSAATNKSGMSRRT